jgi:hypothetical protein
MYPATLSVTEGVGAAKTMPVKVNARGLTRRTAGYCQFPPLLLTFDKTAVRDTVFREQDELKLVTSCRTGAEYEQRIVLEYLAYRFYNLMTPMSFRVRPADVTYHNNDGGGADVTRFGFVIEEIGDVARRNQRERLKAGAREVKRTQLDHRATARASLFEFMIGNLDWDFTAGPAGDLCCHNSRLLAAKDVTPAAATAIVPVPYDFDYSGLVDAPYSGPPEGIPVTRLTDRYHRGYCDGASTVPAVVEEYRARRTETIALIRNEPRLNERFKTKTIRFMERFFAILDDPDEVQSRLVMRCR